MRRFGCLTMVFAVATAGAGAQGRLNAEAIRLNNRGVALMGQQFTEKAEQAFAEAFRKDPAMAQAAINDGIALLTLQKLDDAEKRLREALAVDSNNPQAWYNLGLAQHANNELEGALESFQKAARNDPRDADSLYFEGVCYREMKQFDKAIEVLRQALQIQPLHASSEFALARALQAMGDKDAAKEHFKLFQHMTSTKIAAAIGLAYGEEGRYSTVTPVGEPQERQRAMAQVTFADQRAVFPVLSSPRKSDGSRASGPGSSPETGAGCMLDVTGDGQLDLVVMQDGEPAIRVLHRSPGGQFQDVDVRAAGLAASGRAVACAVGDYDSDGLNDLAVAFDDSVHLFRNLGKGKFQDVTGAAGLRPKNHPSGITFLDFDHDGDLDLFVTGTPLRGVEKDRGGLEPESAGEAANVLWRNNGDKTFTDWTEPTALGGSGHTAAAILTDFNNDRAIDLAVTGDGPSPVFFVNPREGKYPQQPLYKEKLPSTTGIAVFDYDKDGWMDVAVSHNAAPGLTLWRNVADLENGGRRFERVPLPLTAATRGWGLTAVDIDNDGWIDLAALVETTAGPRIAVFRNKGDGSFEDVSRVLGLDRIHLTAPRGIIAADVYGDGRPDLIVLQQGAPPVLLRNEGESRNHSVRLDLTGYADNKTALGAKVEIFADGQWQKWELAGSAGSGAQGPPSLLAGLGSADHIDLLRILWPTGVLQDEIDLPHTRVVTIKEADRRGSSCPVLFAWDGDKYRMVTDVIGAAVVGHWFSPARRNIPNPGEWIKIDGEKLADVRGRRSLRLIEPMEEVNYIDQIRLVAVDHPEDVEVNPDERFLDDPPFASGRVIASRGLRLPAGAWDGEGKDVLDDVSRRDHTFGSGFTRTSYDGFANLHSLTLDLGQVESDAPLRLLMTGYVNYFSATSLYGAWQAGIKPIAPYIEAQRPDGTWETIPGEAGFPAGLERTIVVNLTGKLPPGTRKIRLMSNLEIFWDQVLIDSRPQAESRSTELPLFRATERFRGYPTQIEGKSPGDLNYDYDRVSLTGPFQHQRGNYTRFGDITELVKGIDDRYAIFGSGEEIDAEFDATRLPALPSNWKRDYFFYANGYVKDMDWWDAMPFTVADLPFHRMSSYPYPATESFPEDVESINYQLEYNDRFDSGEPVRTYRFDYRLMHSIPDEVDRCHPACPASCPGAGEACPGQGPEHP